ncbi:DsbC family protein [Simiduia curdlanivorans]|uniref:Thiol:disulfide interchange protein n=1 Tax=Simiduia curdlanivorans TaxID=1492769 RepID=A0ABV8V8W3_9GAMM|nr:DsbC family protein [Simiduia curdlanivorans]MDN3639776.1 DsbC family protein [Simiduia curdlanivorans]
MLKKVKGVIAVVSVLASMGVSAQLATGIAKLSPEIEARLTAKISAAVPHMAVEGVTLGPFPGIYAVKLANGPVVYTDVAGDLFIAGDLYRIQGGRLIDVGELEMQKDRKPKLAALDNKDMIVYPAKGKTRGAIYVFTDVDCGFCRKLHQEVPALNAAGVEVRYLAYPRAGLRSESYNKLARAWCSDDQQGTLTRLKSGLDIQSAVCPQNPIAKQYEFGSSIGVRGTPAIFLESGELISGYRTSDVLLEALGLDS